MKNEDSINSRSGLSKSCELSIVVPVFNEQDVLPLFHKRIVSSLQGLDVTWEIIYVDDGSVDDSLNIVKQFRLSSPAVGALSFSRNFGKEQAMTAGIKLANGNAVIIIDADLQDPPELIASMISAWREGADVVNMRRRSRQGESVIKRVTAHAFYRVINSLSDIDIPENVGDFRLLSRRAIDALNKLGESNRFMKGLFAWIGYHQISIEYDRDPRAAGKTKWNYWKLWNFAIEGITGFSTIPLKIASYAGFFSAICAFIYAVYFVLKTQILGEPVPGFPTLIVTMLFLGGLQLMAIGVIGEYLGRIFIESKNRPLYLMNEVLPPASTTEEHTMLNNELKVR